MSHLFSPLHIGTLALPNRIVIAPMCQYSAHEGSATDWHLIHLGHLALSGAGLLILEATAVEAVGRITPGCLGLYSDANEAALARVLQAVRAQGNSNMPIAIQLAHAGRKASSRAPWQGAAQIPLAEPGAWRAVAPSAVPHIAGEDAPEALDDAGLARVKAAFVQAAERAARLGLQGIELHAAHGYLLHQFLSPIANQRTDAYGGSLANRMRFPLEVFDAVRAASPAERPVWVRVRVGLAQLSQVMQLPPNTRQFRCVRDIEERPVRLRGNQGQQKLSLVRIQHALQIANHPLARCQQIIQRRRLRRHALERALVVTKLTSIFTSIGPRRTNSLVSAASAASCRRARKPRALSRSADC